MLSKKIFLISILFLFVNCFSDASKQEFNLEGFKSPKALIKDATQCVAFFGDIREGKKRMEMAIQYLLETEENVDLIVQDTVKATIEEVNFKEKYALSKRMKIFFDTHTFTVNGKTIKITLPEPQQEPLRFWG